MLMKDLIWLYQELGCQNIESYIQSGNVIFDLDQNLEVGVLEKKLELSIMNRFGFEVPVIVRTTKEWDGIINGNPFLKEGMDINCLHLSCLKDWPTPELLNNMRNIQYLPDRYEIVGKDVFVYCENGYGRTKLTNDFFEKKLKVQASTRNWKTVMKLHEMVVKI